jgi:hypothetical protein
MIGSMSRLPVHPLAGAVAEDLGDDHDIFTVADHRGCGGVGPLHPKTGRRKIKDVFK